MTRYLVPAPEELCVQCRQRPRLARSLCARCYQQQPEFKARRAAYEQQPEVKARRAAYRLKHQIAAAEAKLARLRERAP